MPSSVGPAATTEIYTLSLHDALPICGGSRFSTTSPVPATTAKSTGAQTCALPIRSEEHTSELQSLRHLGCRLQLGLLRPPRSTLFPYTTRFRSVAVPDFRLLHPCRLRRRSRLGLRRVLFRSDRKSTRLNSSHLGISDAVFSWACCDHRDLHSFPTRRASDLWRFPIFDYFTRAGYDGEVDWGSDVCSSD